VTVSSVVLMVVTKNSQQYTIWRRIWDYTTYHVQRYVHSQTVRWHSATNDCSTSTWNYTAMERKLTSESSSPSHVYSGL